MEAYYSNAHLDVVEIDPEVTKVVYSRLGLPKDTKIRSFNTDGRWFVMNCRGKYDVIFIDAYNDLSIPYHLTTKEFAGLLKDLLNPGGIIMTNIIDNFQKGAFLPSYMRTLREVFGERNVHLISISPQFAKTRISTFVVLTGNGETDIRGFESSLGKNPYGDTISSVVPEKVADTFLSNSYSVVLRDDYAPVDNLIAPVFETRFGYNRKDR
jgi:spermidine synthase